ncbi:hypothetical protein FBY06_14337 [Pseudomonas sp. SJZ085]|nr:hypothetical protein FBX99_14337 [Pseudomonas sp. SJZ074]TWC12945.1 hypothetical protein FBY00_123100 [Pseudomonas sp. SJZ075]TWC29283.1 hypothetical protein FBY02_1233 [Pseudomonas sp. SJZ078]TWC30276.1 hypothetical protein FBY06_14337 [Pseudomonas sp. SJZ085]TWC49739.1 hypothetical protein FBY11_1224 [Pseudomonas sp. SJZ124]TWC85151.1 hypothetical protein FBY09_123101 [Pseudomonas sp. SJZ101]
MLVSVPRPLNIRSAWRAFIYTCFLFRRFDAPSGVAFVSFRTIHQPQRIHPPRRVQGVPVPIEPTRQFARVRRQVAARFRIVVAVPVVVQAAFQVMVLALEAQRLFQLFAAAVLDRTDLAVAVVARRPDDLAAVLGQFLGGPGGRGVTSDGVRSDLAPARRVSSGAVVVQGIDSG